MNFRKKNFIINYLDISRALLRNCSIWKLIQNPLNDKYFWYLGFIDIYSIIQITLTFLTST
jgi:hypothetical protein